MVRRPPTAREPSTCQTPPEVDRARPRHWLGEAVDVHGQVPALLLEWRQTPDGWEARVVRPILDVEDGKWRPRALVRPLSAARHGGRWTVRTVDQPSVPLRPLHAQTPPRNVAPRPGARVTIQRQREPVKSASFERIVNPRKRPQPRSCSTVGHKRVLNWRTRELSSPPD